MTTKHTEAEVAAVVVAHLTVRGYDVYSEVELRPQGIRADIVARRGPELTIVETKTSASLALLYQAMERRRYAHRIYVAVPVPARAMIEICESLGVGVLRVRMGSDSQWDQPRVDEELISRRWNTKPLKLAAKLRPEHKTACPAGSATGGHWRRWRETCAQLARVVAAEPGLPIKEAIAATTHHYSSARCAASTMAAHVREGRVPGVQIRDGALWPVTIAVEVTR